MSITIAAAAFSFEPSARAGDESDPTEEVASAMETQLRFMGVFHNGVPAVAEDLRLLGTGMDSYDNEARRNRELIAIRATLEYCRPNYVTDAQQLEPSQEEPTPARPKGVVRSPDAKCYGGSKSEDV